MELKLALAGWRAGAAVDEVDGSLLLLEIDGRSSRVLLTFSLGRSIAATPAAGTSAASRPIAVVHLCALGLLWIDAIGEGATLARGVVGVLVPRALAIE